MSVERAKLSFRNKLMIAATLLLSAGCANISPEEAAEKASVDMELRALAIQEVRAKQAVGTRVWCVPFARTASGVQIRGNANTWWAQAAGQFERTKTPEVGAVMAFSKSRRLSMGHVAVVAEIVSSRMVRIDHANWHRNKISLGMGVIDVSENNDWSRVKVETNPGAYGSPYAVSGFILPGTAI